MNRTLQQFTDQRGSLNQNMCSFEAKSEGALSLVENKRIAAADGFLFFRGEPIEVTCESDGAPEMLLEWSCWTTDLKSGRVESCRKLSGFSISHVRLFHLHLY